MCEKRAARLFSASTGAMLCVGISRRQHPSAVGGGGRAIARVSPDYKTAAVMVAGDWQPGSREGQGRNTGRRRGSRMHWAC
jgi:hypothetical protein